MSTIFTASDLDKRRTDVLREARDGTALIRATDGTGLVMTRASRVEVLEQVNYWYEQLHHVERALALEPDQRPPSAYGELSWLRHLGEDDLREFVAEMWDVVTTAKHDEGLAELRTTVADWRSTAEQLSDPDRRAVLLGDFDGNDFVEAARPSQSE